MNWNNETVRTEVRAKKGLYRRVKHDQNYKTGVKTRSM